MRVLLDECVDRHLAPDLVGHDVRTVTDMGWNGIANGDLLARAQQQFDVFLTVDKNLPHQQSVAKFSVAVLVVRAPTNRLADLRPLVPRILDALPVCQPGQVSFVTA
jgi:hypothetical protein